MSSSEGRNKSDGRENEARSDGMRKKMKLKLIVAVVLLFCAFGANADKFELRPLNDEAGGAYLTGRRWGDIAVCIADTSTAFAPHMHMRGNVAVKMFLRSCSVQAEYFTCAGQEVEIAVHCPQADSRQFLPHHPINFVSGRMGSDATEHFQNNCPLLGHSCLWHKAPLLKE
jgi:hypothetical protein